MTVPQRRSDEERRLEVLREYQLLDTRPEPLYDSFVRVASAIAQTPVALVSLIDRDRQWFKANVGLESGSTPRDEAFCAHAIYDQDPLIVEDTLQDARFAHNPSVEGDPKVRFYAGFPLRSPEGFGLGTLCVIDREPRRLTASQEFALRELSACLLAVMERRRSTLQLFDAAHNELFHYDPQSDRFNFTSLGALQMLGYTAPEMASLGLRDVFPDFGGTRFDVAMRQMRAGQSFVGEFEAKRRTGDTVAVELHCEINSALEREGVFMVGVNLSQRDAARAQIDVLLSAVNVAGDAMLVYEVDARGDLVVSYANIAFYEQTGYGPGDVVGKPLEYFRREMPDDPGMQQVRDAIANGSQVKTELCSYRKDGRSFWNQVTLVPIRGAQGSITHWISTERDVTDAIERESHLEGQNARLVSLSTAARSLFGTLEAAELARRFQIAVRDLTGATALVHHLDAERHADPLLVRASAEQRPVWEDERRRAVFPAGSSTVADVRRSHALGEADIASIELLAQYFAVAARNASLVGEIEQQRNAVLELNQVKTDLIAMLAHDFKGPLTNILGYADLTAEMGDLNGDQQEYLESIRRAALRLADLATDTLALSRLERNEIDLSSEPLDLAALLRSVIEANDSRPIALRVEGEPVLHGDPRRLRQVFYNLVENAIKYSPNGEPVGVHLFEQEKCAVVQIDDRGIGIPQKDLDRIFERFTRASNARKMRISGTGFGLFLANQIVEMHGGRIEVESRENQGSTFRVFLPLAGQERIARPLRVAVIEAETEARSFITHTLREAGLRARLLHSVVALFEDDMFETDRVVIDCDAMDLDERVLERLRNYARVQGVGIVAVGSDPFEPDAWISVLKRPYLMRDLVEAVQASKSTRSAPE